MKYRIAIWAIAGFLVANGWGVYFLVTNKYDIPRGPILTKLVELSCPIAIVGMHHAVSLNSSIVANIATYALIGLIVEALRRQLKHSN